jgi:TRAP-type C4-dicarboxylate transport system permease small subunit
MDRFGRWVMKVKTQCGILVLACGMAWLGWICAFMIAVLHGAEGDWWYMVIVIVMTILGVAVLRPVVRQLQALTADTGDSHE